MSPQTYAHAALDRIEAERDRLADERSAFARFDAGVRDTDPVPAAESNRPTASGRDTVALAAATVHRSATGSKKAARIRALYDDTVRSEADSAVDESIDEAMAADLGRPVATALAPATAGRFTPEVKAALRAAVGRRRAELRTIDRALDAERASIERALGGMEPIVDWIARENERPLTNLGFEALREHHETLEAHRARCEAIVRERQEALSETVGAGTPVALDRRPFAESLYEGVPTSYPVLSTAARLDDLCGECQRTVRDHLVRRA